VRGAGDDQVRDVPEHAEGVVDLEADTAAHPVGQGGNPDHQRVPVPAAGEEAQHRGLAAQLVLGVVQPGDVLDLGDRQQPAHPGAEGEPQHRPLVGESVDSPEGYNIKRYGVWQGSYGIYKQRLHPLSGDTESEVAAYLLAKRLGVPCCPAYRTGADTIFSEFTYDFTREYIVHVRRLFDGPRSENEYRNLISVRPQFKDDIARMILFDAIMRQDDRHLSNIAIKVSGQGESFYPLYDNGRSLFYEDTPEMVQRAVADPILYATTFGSSGTYWDYATEISAEYGDLDRLITLDITGDEVHAILLEAGFSGYRLEGATAWISAMMGMLAAL